MSDIGSAAATKTPATPPPSGTTITLPSGEAAKATGKYQAAATDPAAFGRLAYALTGRKAAERTPAQNAMLASLRKDILDGKISPEVVTTGKGGEDRLPENVRGAYVDEGKGRILISGRLTSPQRQATMDEEMGEAIAAHAERKGIKVADGDAGDRLRRSVNGKPVNPDATPALYRDMVGDTATVLSKGREVEAQADLGGAFGLGAAGFARPERSSNEKTKEGTAFAAKFDENGDGFLGRFEMANMLGDGKPTPQTDRLMKLYGISANNKEYVVPLSGLAVDKRDYANANVGSMFFDGVATLNGGNITLELSAVDVDTVAKSIVRFVAVKRAKGSSGGSTVSSAAINAATSDIAKTGMTAAELTEGTKEILGTANPLDVSGKLDATGAERVIWNFDANSKREGGTITTDQLILAFDRKAIGNFSAGKDGVINYTVDRNVHGAYTVQNTVNDMTNVARGASSGVVIDGENIPTGEQVLQLAASALNKDNDLPIGRYEPPVIKPVREGDRLFTPGNFAIRSDDENVTLVKDNAINYTVKKDSPEGRYLLDYGEFFGGPLEVGSSQPGRNLQKSQQKTTTYGDAGDDEIELWMPRKHQFTTTGSEEAELYSAPVVTVNGKVAKIVAINSVAVSKDKVISVVTVERSDGRRISIGKEVTAATPSAALAFNNLSQQLNGPGASVAPFTTIADLGETMSGQPASLVASVLDNMDPDAAAQVLLVISPAKRKSIYQYIEPNALENVVQAVKKSENGDSTVIRAEIEAADETDVRGFSDVEKLLEESRSAKATAKARFMENGYENTPDSVALHNKAKSTLESFDDINLSTLSEDERIELRTNWSVTMGLSPIAPDDLKARINPVIVGEPPEGADTVPVPLPKPGIDVEPEEIEQMLLTPAIPGQTSTAIPPPYNSGRKLQTRPLRGPQDVPDAYTSARSLLKANDDTGMSSADIRALAAVSVNCATEIIVTATRWALAGGVEAATGKKLAGRLDFVLPAITDTMRASGESINPNLSSNLNIALSWIAAGVLTSGGLALTAAIKDDKTEALGLGGAVLSIGALTSLGIRNSIITTDNVKKNSADITGLLFGASDAFSGAVGAYKAGKEGNKAVDVALLASNIIKGAGGLVQAGLVGAARLSSNPERKAALTVARLKIGAVTLGVSAVTNGVIGGYNIISGK